MLNRISKTFDQYRSNPLLPFTVKAIGLYILWYLVYEQYLHKSRVLDIPVINNLVELSSWLLEALGYTLIQYKHMEHGIQTMGIDGTHGLWVGDPCNGLTIFALFAGFIIAFPNLRKPNVSAAKYMLQKIVYITFGIIGIHILNVIRIAALCIVLVYAPDTLDFNHTYTFTIVVYSFVFLLWYYWTTRQIRMKR